MNRPIIAKIRILLFLFAFTIGQDGKVAASAPRTNTSCECGLTSDGPSERIIGGTVAAPHTYPSMAAILDKGKQHCGGALINDRYILTAGHCFDGVKEKDLTIALGVHNVVDMNEGTEETFTVDKIIVHREYDDDFLSVDIALIRLKDPVHFNNYISPVCLAERRGRDAYANEVADVIGWGRTAENGRHSSVLQQAEVKVIPLDECRKSPIGDYIEEHPDTILCAYADKTDSCQGDSGGPLMFKTRPGKMEQIGVVSLGNGCGRKGVPGVYTAVYDYVEWILEQTTDGVYCANKNE